MSRHRLAIFDLDNTLLAGDSDYLWGQFLIDKGLVEAKTHEAENRRFYQEYVDGKLDINEFAAFSLNPLKIHGSKVLSALRAEYVKNYIEPIVAESATALLERHRIEGDTLVITTATNRFITDPIAELLGVEYLLATDAEIIDGEVTGKIAGTANFQAGKISNLKKWISENDFEDADTIAYSDSGNDIPLLEWANTTRP